MNNRCANIGKFFWSTTTINNNNWENPENQTVCDYLRQICVLGGQ